jgi:sec-independent protein translocase protein TatC
MAGPLSDTLHSLRLPPHLVYANPVDPFILYTKLSIMCGLFLASPYVFWQFWHYSSPPLYRHENRYRWPFVTLTSTLFVAGGLFAYKLAVPAALRFLLSPGSRIPMALNEYWNLAITLMVGVGLMFELPGLFWLIYLKKEQGTKTTRSIET